VATTVIIPARNEEVRIGAIVRTFAEHPETARQVFVGLDADTVDSTAGQVWANGGCAFHTDQRGKGQVVNAALTTIASSLKISKRIILCDADYSGLTAEHISRILEPRTRDGMIIGVPDYPDIDVPAHVINAWHRVSGFRCLPWTMIPHDAHGYLLETQLNLIAVRRRLPILSLFMPGLKAPFTWPFTDRRLRELQRDQTWGKTHGIL
jgi:hypothetical protein